MFLPPFISLTMASPIAMAGKRYRVHGESCNAMSARRIAMEG
jgi:hypothetical protein